MQPIILIDGYNLIYQFPELRKLLERDLESARYGLLTQIKFYISNKRVQVIIVFDGDGRPVPEVEKMSDIRVIFSKPPEKADPVIKRLIEAKQESQLRVVSSDQEIVNYARLHGAKTVSSRQFAYLLSSQPDNDVEKKFDHSMSQDELKEWLDLFQEGNPPEGLMPV